MPIIQSCTCRFRATDVFSERTLIAETECGYHAAMRRRSDVSRDSVLEEAAKLAENLHPDDWAFAASKIRALKSQPDNSPRKDQP